MEFMDNLRRKAAESIRRNPTLWNALQPSYRAARDKLNEVRLWAAVRGQMNFDAASGNDQVRRALESGKPLGLGKIGSLEAEGAACYLAGNDYSPILRKQLLENVGIHPNDRTHLDSFCETFVRAADQLDMLACQGHPGECAIIKRVPNRPLVRLRAFESWLHPHPWSAALGGKRVVVITPFAKSVTTQFARRAEIWRDQNVLPPCELRAVRMPLSPGLVAPVHRSWRERLDALIEDLEGAPYDVILVGAGGLSLPLVAHAKAQGKVGFHLGGHTQILFGITGRRWDKDDALHRLQTPAWVRPSGDEAPATVVKVEQGCYW
jgi:hypothetical protein